MDSNKTAGEEARRQLHKNAASNLEQVLAATPHKTPTVRPPASYHENYSSKTNQTCRTLLEKQGRTHKWCTLMDPHTWPCKSSLYSSRWPLSEDSGFNSYPSWPDVYLVKNVVRSTTTMEGSNYLGYGHKTQYSYPRSQLITWRRPEVNFCRNVVKKK